MCRTWYVLARSRVREAGRVVADAGATVERRESRRPPTQILVRKAFPNRRRREKPRVWKLQRMAVNAGASASSSNDKKRDTTRAGYGDCGHGGTANRRDPSHALAAAVGEHWERAPCGRASVHSDDYEQFLRDLEEDKELRASVNLFKGAAGSRAGWVCAHRSANEAHAGRWRASYAVVARAAQTRP